MIWQIVDGCIDESGCLFFFLFHAQSIYICIIRWDEKVGDKKKKKKRCIERRVEYDKGMENLGHGKRQNIVFPFFSGTTMARQGGDGVFRKNTSAPAHGCRCYIFFPRVPLFFIAFFSLLGRRAGCEISKRKHWSEVKSSQLLNFLLLLLLFFSFDRNRIQIEGKNYPKNFFEFHYSNDRRRNRRIKYRSIN